MNFFINDYHVVVEIKGSSPMNELDPLIVSTSGTGTTTRLVAITVVAH